MSLPVAPSERPRRLAGPDGKAVWPLWSRDIEAALDRLCRIFGREPARAPAMPVEGGPPCDGESENGSVVALELRAAEAAALFAHLTGRRFAGCATLDELDVAQPRVLVATFDSWSNDLVRRLAQPVQGGKTLPGLILARDPDSLMTQVILRSAALRLSGGPPGRRVALFTDAPISVLGDGGDLILGERASSEDVVRATSPGTSVSVLSLVTHCDAIDAKLSENAVLCPLLDQEERYRRYEPLMCLKTGHCYRTHKPRREAETEGALLPPRILNAAVLVFDACTVFPATDERIHPADSLGARLVEDCATGAILCNTEVFVADVPRNSHLIMRLGLGWSVGEAAAEFNMAEGKGRGARRLIVIGDPDLSIAPANGQNGEVPAARETRLVRPTTPTVFADVGFSRALAAAMRDSHGARAAAPIKRWVASLDTLEQALYTSPDDATGTAAAQDLIHRCAIAQARAFATNASRFTQCYWLRWSVLGDEPEPAPCFCCGAEMNCMDARFSNAALRRSYRICPNCSAGVDQPAGAEIAFARTGERSYTLRAVYNGYPARARLFMHAPYPQGRRVWRWPVDRHGRLAPNIRLGPPDPDGPWMVGLFVSWGIQFAGLLAPAASSAWTGRAAGL